jgi:hypothetical protein
MINVACLFLFCLITSLYLYLISESGVVFFWLIMGFFLFWGGLHVIMVSGFMRGSEIEGVFCFCFCVACNADHIHGF